MVRWMCGIKVKDRVPSKELRERVGLDDNLGATAKQVAMVWAIFGHVLRKEDNDWVKKCIEYKVEDAIYQEVDQRKLGRGLCKKTVRHVN